MFEHLRSTISESLGADTTAFDRLWYVFLYLKTCSNIFDIFFGASENAKKNKYFVVRR